VLLAPAIVLPSLVRLGTLPPSTPLGLILLGLVGLCLLHRMILANPGPAARLRAVKRWLLGERASARREIEAWKRQQMQGWLKQHRPEFLDWDPAWWEMADKSCPVCHLGFGGRDVDHAMVCRQCGSAYHPWCFEAIRAERGQCHAVPHCHASTELGFRRVRKFPAARLRQKPKEEPPRQRLVVAESPQDEPDELSEPQRPPSPSPSPSRRRIRLEPEG
jgi:hypothetical protein